MIEIGFSTSVGFKRRRKPNQDSVGILQPGWFSRKRLPILVVADGMGGQTGGEVASKIVVDTILKVYKRLWRKKTLADLLLQGIYQSHSRIKRKVMRNQNLASMGSTVVVAILNPEERVATIANVGDSRAYLLNQKGAQVISYDQSQVADKLRAGIITSDQLIQDPQRNILTMSISALREEISPVTAECSFKAGEVILLCSDGLWGAVQESIIYAVALELPPQKAAEKLVFLANIRGGPDNISVAIARRSGEHLQFQIPDDMDDGD